MKVDDGFVDDSGAPQGALSFNVDLAMADFLSVEGRGSTAGLGSDEHEQERQQNLERELIDRVIEVYEDAVEKGLCPQRAIASMLEWASRECPRLLP